MSLLCASSHLFHKVSGFPGCFGRSSLFAFAALPLLQAVFVFCGSIHVPRLQRCCYMLPKTPRHRQQEQDQTSYLTASYIHTDTTMKVMGSPWLVLVLLLYRPDLLLGDWQLGGVNHLVVSVAVGELQHPVPLPLGFTHNVPCLVVLYVRCYSVRDQHRLIYSGQVQHRLWATTATLCCIFLPITSHIFAH